MSRRQHILSHDGNVSDFLTLFRYTTCGPRHANELSKRFSGELDAQTLYIGATIRRGCSSVLRFCGQTPVLQLKARQAPTTESVSIAYTRIAVSETICC
jgi:hypothetical protein